ncbi:MAG: hypothetical protein U0263_41940 [Polyangiaceae bacterium]
MRDPHVERIRFAIKTDDTLELRGPPDLMCSTPDFDIRVSDHKAEFSPRAHFTDPEPVRALAQPTIDAWELHYALEHGRRELHFVYDGADVVDRDPPPPGTGQMHAVGAALEVSTAFAARVAVIRRQYPALPGRFVATPDVIGMWDRYERAERGGELLASAAYACLSLAQRRFGGRRALATAVNIDLSVLDKLGELSSDVGDLTTARKFDGRSTLRAHTASERYWLQVTVRALIRRVGEHDADPNTALQPLTLAKLPQP